MNVSLRPLEDRDLDTIYQQVTDPESVRMAAFTAEDQTDRRAFLNRMSRVRADTSVTYRVFDVDGAIVERPRLPNVHCTPEQPRTTSVRFAYRRKLGSDALASTATSHPVAVRRSRKRSCASTEVGTELCVSS